MRRQDREHTRRPWLPHAYPGGYGEAAGAGPGVQRRHTFPADSRERVIPARKTPLPRDERQTAGKGEEVHQLCSVVEGQEAPGEIRQPSGERGHSPLTMSARRSIAPIITWLAAIFIALVVIIVPTGHFFVSYQYIKGSVVTEARISAATINQVISAN